MTPTETITFVCGLIMCVIGIATFVTGIVQRAKNDGVLTNKVDTALTDLKDIKKTLSEQRSWREEMVKTTEGHEQKIKTLFEAIDEIKHKIDRFHS